MTELDVRHPFASMAGKAAVVTGGARGIGYEIARLLLSVDMHVLILDRDAEALQAAAASLKALGTISVEPCNLSSDDDLPRVERVLRDMPALAVWVNNAGVVSHQSAENVDLSTFETIMRDNATSALRGCQVAYRRMVGQQHGSIVNIASLAVDKVLPERLTYAATKAAVVSITRYAAQDWGPKGIRVNAISPGYISTRLTQWAPDDPREIAKHETMSRIAARRVGQPEEIARAVLFLASDLASYVNGEIIHVDGGWQLV